MDTLRFLVSSKKWQEIHPLFFLASLIVLTCALWLGILGLDRPYDAVPDQDLLWLREGMLMAQGKAPGYPDHPGIFWSIAYTIKLLVFSFFNPPDFNLVQPISANSATLIIRVARVENSILAAITAISVWPVLRQLKVSPLLSAIAVITTGLSTGFLESTVQVRNELSSMFFLLSYTSLNLSLANTKYHSRLPIKIGIAFVLFLLAAYCKVQILLLSPFAFALIYFAPILSLDHPPSASTQIRQPINNRIQWIAKAVIAFLVAGPAPWLLAVSGPIFSSLNRFSHVRTELDLPSWTLINTSVVMLAFLRSGEKKAWRKLFQISGIYLLCVILFSRVFSYPVWTAQVFSFPSNLLGFSRNSNPIPEALYGFDKYTTDIFGSYASASVAILGFVGIFSILITVYQLISKRCETETAGKTLLLGCVALAWISSLTRVRGFYEVYLVIPSLIWLCLLASNTTPARLSNCLKAGATACILFAMIKSLANIKSFGHYSNMQQDRSFLCFEQAFDASMSDTSISKCKNFKDYVKRNR